MLTRRVTICDSAANAYGLDEYRPFTLGVRMVGMWRKRTVCPHCDGEGLVEVWADADTLTASLPCPFCNGTAFVPRRRWLMVRVRPTWREAS